jgi:hypothetical protein
MQRSQNLAYHKRGKSRWSARLAIRSISGAIILLLLSSTLLTNLASGQVFPKSLRSGLVSPHWPTALIGKALPFSQIFLLDHNRYFYFNLIPNLTIKHCLFSPPRNKDLTVKVLCIISDRQYIQRLLLLRVPGHVRT